MGKYRGLNITGGLNANFRKIKVRKTLDTMELLDRGSITETKSDLPTKGAAHRRGRGALKSQRKGANSATRGSISMGWIAGDDSNVIGEHDYGYVFRNAESSNSAVWSTRRALGVAASIADEQNAVATAPVYASGVSLYNSTGIIPAGTPLILNEDGTVSAISGTIGSTSGFIGYSRYSSIPAGYQGGSVSKERIATDSQGNTYVGNLKTQPHPNNPYQQVFFIEKYDSSGNLVWIKEEAGTAIPNATNYQQGEVKFIVCDNNDDIIWTGYDVAGGNPILVKMSPDANVTWTKRYDKGAMSGININSLAVDSNNNILFNGVTYMNGGEGYVGKIDTNGNLLWSTEIKRTTGGTWSPQVGRTIHSDSSGNIITLGTTYGGGWHNFCLLKVNGSTGALDTYVELGDTNSTARAYSLILDNNDNMYVCGATDHRAYYDPANPSGQHDEDMIVFKFNSLFQLEWQKLIGTPDSTVSQGGRGIEIDSAGNIIAIGYGLSGGIIAKIQQDGTLIRIYHFKSGMSYWDDPSNYHNGGSPSLMMTKGPDDKFYWASAVSHSGTGPEYDALYSFKIDDSVLGTYTESNPDRIWVWSDVTDTGDLIYQDHTLQTSGSWTTTLTYADHTSLDTWNTHSVSFTDTIDLETDTSTFESAAITNLTDSNFIGFAKDNFDSATIGKVVGVGGVIDGLTGLVVGTDYYIQPDGSLSATETEGSVFAGTAITTSSLEIKYGTGTWQGERGVFLNSGEYINFATVGSATNFPVSIGGPSDVVNSGFSDGTTVFAASYSAFGTFANIVTLSTAEPMSESTSFGRQNRGITAAGNGITGLAASGAGYDYQSRDYEWTDRTNDIYAINIVTKVGGNVIGDLLTTPYASTANNNTTNAFFSGGSYGSTAVQTVAFESLGNASYFGHNLGLVRRWAAGAGNENKAFIIGGYMTTQTGGALNSIDGFNTQTAGTSESLGSLTVQREGNVSISDGTYIVAAGGANTYGYGRTGYVSSDRFVIDTGGTAEAFGDLGSGQYKSAGASGNSA